MRALGDQLRRAGLTQPALLAWAGTHRVSMLWLVIPALAVVPTGGIPPAAVALSLFVAGAQLPRTWCRALPIDDLVAANLVEVNDGVVRATVAILPIEQALIVADRRDAADERDLVCWPDDSSYHLANALEPGRRERWIDLATGSAFSPMARPGLASTIDGIDLNPRAVRFAQTSAALSGIGHFQATVRDVATCRADSLGRAPLVTCNAPIIDDPDRAIWRSTTEAFFTQLWLAAQSCVTDDGEVVVHSVLDGVHELPGQVATVIYSRLGERDFCVTWWRPSAPDRRCIGRRPLTPARPHLEPRDRDDVLAGALPPSGHRT